MTEVVCYRWSDIKARGLSLLETSPNSSNDNAFRCCLNAEHPLNNRIGDALGAGGSPRACHGLVHQFGCQFGKITNVQTDPRAMQFGVKFTF